MGTFDALSDLDFEELVADLMRARHGLPFRAGARGPDAGIDVLATDPSGGMHAVQCKHYRTSTYRDLKRAARREAEGLAERGTRVATYSARTQPSSTKSPARSSSP